MDADLKRAILCLDKAKHDRQTNGRTEVFDQGVMG